MDTLIYLIIAIVVLAVVAYGLKWICTSFGLPQPILWLCGAVLLIIVLIFAAREFGGGTGFHFTR